jgi:hypothetical protein
VPTDARDIRDRDIREGARLRAGRLAVVFRRRGDRIGHRIVFVGDTVEQLLLESVEGTPDEPWPASPALQEGRIETTGGRNAAMLVGMAGKSHWSVSIEADAQRESLLFDVACRIKLGGGQLASAYLRVDMNGVSLSPVENCRLRQLADRLVLEPELVADELPATVRWRNRVQS